MPSCGIPDGDNEVREIYHHVDVDHEDGWTRVLRGNGAILRVRVEPVQPFEVLDEARSGEPAWKLAPR
jgi:hypothetical protein